MSTNPEAAGSKASIQVIERMMNLLDALANHSEAVTSSTSRPRRLFIPRPRIASLA
jgi:hypothetical protein